MRQDDRLEIGARILLIIAIAAFAVFLIFLIACTPSMPPAVIDYEAIHKMGCITDSECGCVNDCLEPYRGEEVSCWENPVDDPDYCEEGRSQEIAGKTYHIYWNSVLPAK